MKIKIREIRNEEGEIYLSCICVKPLLRGLSWKEEDDALYQERNTEHKIAVAEFRKAIEQIRLGEYELPL